MNHLSGRICTIALTLAFIAMLVFSGCAELTGKEGPHAAPLIYSADGQVYMACGENTIGLGGAQVIEDGEKKTIRAEISEDNGTLIYIADYNISTGAGTLMGAHTDCLTQPYRIDTDVYAAEISADGNRVLLIKNVADDAGDLYHYKGAGKPQYVTGGVSRENLGFSPDGKTICYEMEQKLYIQEEGRKAEEAADASKTESFNVMNGGGLLYRASSCIYFFSDGAEQVEAEDAMLYKVQEGTGMYIYQTDEGLFSKQPGREAKLLIEDAQGTRLYTEFQYSGPLIEAIMSQYYGNTFSEERFMICKSDYKEKSTVEIYEQELGKEKVKIAESINCPFIDHHMNTVVFEMSADRGLKTCISIRNRDGWSEPKVIFDFPFFLRGVCPEFDSADQYIYCIQHDFSNMDKRHFWRYDLKEDRAEKLMEDVTGFCLIHDVPYIYTNNGLWKFQDENSVQIMDKTAGKFDDTLIETDEGAFYITATNDIYYIKDSEDEMTEVCSADWVINPFGGDLIVVSI